MDKRIFTVVEVHSSSGKKGKQNTGGRFLSVTPSGAARKAVSQICRSSKIKGQCSLKIVIQETTRGSNGKIYTYKVRRVLDPVTIVRDGVEITYKYKTVVNSV